MSFGARRFIPVLAAITIASLGAGCALLAGLGDYEVSASASSSGGGSTDARADNNTNLEDGSTTTERDSGVDATTSPLDGGEADADGGIAPAPACDPNDPGLIVCLDFDNGISDNAPNPTSVQAVSIALGTGAVGQGALFNGATSHITVAAAEKLANFTALTLEMFVTLEVAPAAGRMGLIDTDGRFGMFIHPTFFLYTIADATFSSPTPLPVKTLTHVALTREGGTVNGYRDGVLVASAPTAAPIAPAGNLVEIGMNAPSGDPFNGMLDEVRIYSRAKTAAEIAADSARRLP